jgi:FAD/FMN-containing dehydrogenase
MINFKNKKIYGWSKSNYSRCNYLEISNIEQIVDVFDYAKKNNNKISLRGGGRSYGDNTLNKDNIVLKHVEEKKIHSFNELSGEILVSGSCTLIELLKFIIPKGWILNVSPASQFITIAGAISNNVHGKNCLAKGYFGDYVEKIEILTPDKGLLNCTNIENSELFYSVISGLGAFGIILKAKIKLRKIKTIKINTDINYVKSINEAVEKSETLIKNFEYNIGSLNFTRFNNNITDGKIHSSNFTEDVNLEQSNSEANY